MKFYWDLRSAPWTDGRGPQDDYADAVESWCDFHDMLEDNSPKGIPSKLRGAMLRAHLSGRAKECARKIPRYILMSKDVAKAVVAAVHRRDALSALSTVYVDFSVLVSS